MSNTLQTNLKKWIWAISISKWIWTNESAQRLKQIWSNASEPEHTNLNMNLYTNLNTRIWANEPHAHPRMAQPERTMIWGSHVRPHIRVLHEALKDLWTPQAMQWGTSAGQVRRFSRIAHHGHCYHLAEVDWVRPQAIEKHAFTAHNESSLASELQTALTSTHLFDQ